MSAVRVKILVIELTILNISGSLHILLSSRLLILALIS